MKTMDFTPELEDVKRLLNKEEYTAAAKEAFNLIERVLRQVVIQNEPRLDEEARRKIENALQNCDAKDKRIERLAMGQVAKVIYKSKFLDAWECVSGRPLRRIWWDHLDELATLRNAFIHEDRKATPDEAESMFRRLKIILEDVECMSQTASVMMLTGKRTAGAQDEPLLAVSYARADNHLISPYFKLGDKSFQALKNDNMPDDVLNSLKPLKDKEFTSKDEFLNAGGKKIEKEPLDRYKELLLKHALSSPEWVSTLVEKLRKHVKQLNLRVSRQDEDMHVTPELLHNLQQTPFLLVILSRSYLVSEWCVQEQNDFLSMVQ